MSLLDVLELSQGDVAVQVVPGRGAIVTSLAVSGRDLLYLDRATLEDPTKNVRGGIPLLFPFAGKLVDEAFLPAGTKMKQHGFGRNKAWLVREQRSDFVRLELAQDAETYAQYPYDYQAEHSVQLLPRGIQIELLVHNKGTSPLPLSPGWHPYFRCAAAKKASVTGDVGDLSSTDFGNDREFDFGLAAPTLGRARFQVPDLGTVSISFSPSMRHMQFWSQPGKDFICLEPFYGPAGTVNTEKRLDVPAGQARELWVRIELL